MNDVIRVQSPCTGWKVEIEALGAMLLWIDSHFHQLEVVVCKIRAWHIRWGFLLELAGLVLEQLGSLLPFLAAGEVQSKGLGFRGEG